MNSNNFDTCRYRSEDEEETIIQRCCGGSTTSRGFVCWHLGIDNLTPSECENCEIYQKKEEEIIKDESRTDPFI